MKPGVDSKSVADEPGGPSRERDEESPDTGDPLVQNAPSRPARAGVDGGTRVDQGGPRNPETVETPVPTPGENPDR